MDTDTAFAPRWLRLSLGGLLALGLVLPLVWDRHDTFWGFRALTADVGPLLFTAKAFVGVGSLLGILLLVRPSFGAGKSGAVALAVGAAAMGWLVLGWGPRLVAGLGGWGALVATQAGAAVVAGLAMALRHGDERGFRVAAVAGAVLAVATLLPMFEFRAGWSTSATTTLWAAALAANGGPADHASTLPLILLGAGAAVCLLAASLVLPQGRAGRARAVAWSVVLPLVMATAVFAWGRGVGPAVERTSTWLGFAVLRLAPAAAVLGLAVAELVSAGRSGPLPASPRPATRPSALTLTAADHARKLRSVHRRQEQGEIDAAEARRQRVEILRAAVSQARGAAPAARALIGELERLEADGVLPATEAQSVRSALSSS